MNKLFEKLARAVIRRAIKRALGRYGTAGIQAAEALEHTVLFVFDARRETGDRMASEIAEAWAALRPELPASAATGETEGGG